MSTTWDWPGSRWWRVDLHTHSPASYDFMPEADRVAKDWEAWLAAAKDAGLDAVAVTDHNTAEGIDALQKAAVKVPDAPVIFPGVEITASDGTHLLLVVDATCTQQHVDELLGLARVPVDQRGKKTARSPLSIEQILSLECERGVIFLGAHVNRAAGLLQHDGQQRIAELRHPRLAAVEIDSAHPIDGTWLDGSRREIARVIQQIGCSDSHTLKDVGRCFTWMKMTQPDAEGLRLALLDGRGSLKPAVIANPGDPNQHADYAIEGITVRQARHMGRWNQAETAKPFEMKFNPWLNALIGGRGTGKSTLVDFCRATFRREDELGGGGESSLRDAFDRRMRVPPNRAEEGLLTADTVVEVTYRKDGELFVLSWDEKKRTPAISHLEDDRRVVEQGDIRERFPVRIYSQKQLFDLARDPNALLTVIDDSGDVRGAELMRLREEAEARYLALGAEARALRAQAADLPSRKATLVDVRRKQQILEKGGHAEALNDYRARRRQNGTWESILGSAADAVDAVGQAAEDHLAVADLDFGPEAEGDSATTALKREHGRINEVVANLRRTVLEAVDRARNEIAGVRTGHDALAWREAVNVSEQKYQTITQSLAEAGIANPDEYRDLLQRAATLEQEIAKLERQRVEAAEREREAVVALRNYRDFRGELTKRRKDFASLTSNNLIKIEIQTRAVREGLEDFLHDAFGIQRFEDDYRALSEQILPEADQPWKFEYLDDQVARLRAVLGDPQEQWNTKDRRFETALRKLQPERIDRVALYLPDDAVEVSFSDPLGTKAGWQPLVQGSPGQKTAALLAFVLGYGHEPIILDQPEDDLDNTLIYKLVVGRLREMKPTRQVIVVTHNPNIVVHGDAELVLSLEARGGQTTIAVSGGLQEQKVRDEICRVMEGGPAAFEERYRRIKLSGER